MIERDEKYVFAFCSIFQLPKYKLELYIESSYKTRPRNLVNSYPKWLAHRHFERKKKLVVQ